MNGRNIFLWVGVLNDSAYIRCYALAVDFKPEDRLL